MCPVCTIGVVAGLGISRYLNVDDLIFGIWLGAFLISMSLWSVIWLMRKIENKLLNFIISIIFWYGLVLFPLYYKGLIGHQLNKFLGVDKLIFGVIIGTITMITGIKLENFLRKKKNGKAFFLFQKVIIPLSLILVISLIFYFLK